MALTKCLVATLLLVFSFQAQALFMPEGFKINADKDAVSDGGCGVLVVRSDATF